MIIIPSTVTIPTVQKTFTENGETTEEKIVEKVDKLITELKWYVDALNAQKAISAPPS